MDILYCNNPADALELSEKKMDIKRKIEQQENAKITLFLSRLPRPVASLCRHKYAFANNLSYK